MSDITTTVQFAYGELSPEVSGKVRAATERIKLRMHRTAEDIVAIGRDLIAAKAALPHGRFGDWLAIEFGMSASTATKFMQVAEMLGGKNVTVTDLTTRALYELAAPSTPEPIRQEVIARAEAGESFTVNQVQSMKRALKASHESEERAKQEAADANARFVVKDGQLKQAVDVVLDAKAKAEKFASLEATIEERARDVEARETEIADLQQRIDELAARPPEVREVEREVIREVIKEVPPEGFLTTKEAIKAAERDLAKKQRELVEVRAEITERQRKADAYNNRQEQIRVKQANVFAFWKRIEAVLGDGVKVEVEASNPGVINDTIRSDMLAGANAIDRLSALMRRMANHHEATVIVEAGHESASRVIDIKSLPAARGMA